MGLGDSLTVLNKSDLLEGEFSNVDSTFYLSCSTGQGVEELLKELIARLGIDGGEETVFMSRQRHEVSLRSGGLFLEEASSKKRPPLLKETSCLCLDINTVSSPPSIPNLAINSLSNSSTP